MNILKYISIYIMSILYIYVGINHFIDTKSFLIIIPPYLQTIGLEIIYLSGIFEIILGILLIIPKYRKIASYGIILLLIAVYPANIYLAFNEEPQNLMGISSFMASWVRLPLQFVFLGLAYWHSKDN
ncbi:uncharacterized protein METZ01_LOCUS336236 [marine metagenome]|uniref:DoxX family protein n=1 Tax=marine metagenome TaxID=408172 RepID=A0A382QFI9_9ZZZZ